MRKYYNLDEIHESIHNGKFKHDVLSMFQNEGLDNTIDYIKVSGICLNKYGKNKHRKYLREILNKLKGLSSPNIEKILDLENEIKLFQELIDKNILSMNDVMNYSFFQSEHLLVNLLIMGQRMAGSIVSQSLSLDSGEYEVRVEAYSKVLWYVLFNKKSRMTSKFDHYEGIDDHMETIIANAAIDFQLGNWIDDWQFANTKIFKDKKKIKIRTSDDKMKVDIAKNRYLTTLEAKISRQTIESHFKNFSTERELLKDLYLNYDNDLEFIKQFLNIENPAQVVDNTIGISLEDLCQAYFCLKELAFQHIVTFKESMELRNASVELNVPIYHSDEIHNFLDSKGIAREKISKLISLIMFSKKSESIFENPLIQIDENRYTIIPQITLTLNITSSIIRLMSKKSILSEKGYGYEKTLKNLVEKNNNLRLLTNIKDDEGKYELDGAFHMGKTLYLCEIKNFSHILNSYEYYKMRFKIDKALNQMERISDFYTREENLSYLYELLEINKDDVEQIKKIIVTSSFLGETINKNGINVTDGILMRNFFKQVYPKVVEFSGNRLKNSTMKEFKVYEEKGLTDENFNSLIKKNPYIKIEQGRFKKGFKTYKLWNLSIQFNELKQPNISLKK
ncbi:hypothetical protein [Bacillus velezensis]|uniref:hypothetical protein n=1 Tax=Bacillus velezensis TaxID=492670 RepID=UPI00207AB656|nr:hypothetical protein [Bacillus velezensis]USK16832.1 hypothetical protein LIT36_18930 [Bacillus velezensis]USK20628.1 hypothetical protein LIS75_19220 [Bacillus velezensis]